MARKAVIRSGSERAIRHTGTKTAGYHREAAVNFGQWGTLIQPCRVYEEGLRVVKYFVREKS